jgi:hypothetical protein
LRCISIGLRVLGSDKLVDLMGNWVYTICFWLEF